MVPSIIIVGADKGGVGKTTVTRVLTDYLRQRQIRHRAFDTEYPSGDLVRFLQNAAVVDINTVEDQMKIFDTAHPEIVTVIDLRAGMLSPTIEALDDAKMLDGVRKGQMKLILLHVLGPTMKSLQEISDTAKRIGGGTKHLVVKNHINKTKFFEWDTESARAEWQKLEQVTINVEQLPEIACEKMQEIGGSFKDFAEGLVLGQSLVLQGRVMTWLERTWAEFDRVRLLEQLK